MGVEEVRICLGYLFPGQVEEEGWGGSDGGEEGREVRRPADVRSVGTPSLIPAEFPAIPSPVPIAELL